MTSFDRYYATPSARNACLLAADDHAAQAIKDWSFIAHLRDASELCEESARLEAINAALAESLAEALRYIEVQQAYRGAMTATEVEAAIRRNSNLESTAIGANSCNTLAKFDFRKARIALALNSQLKG